MGDFIITSSHSKWQESTHILHRQNHQTPSLPLRPQKWWRFPRIFRGSRKTTLPSDSSSTMAHASTTASWRNSSDKTGFCASRDWSTAGSLKSEANGPNKQGFMVMGCARNTKMNDQLTIDYSHPSQKKKNVGSRASSHPIQTATPSKKVKNSTYDQCTS